MSRKLLFQRFAVGTAFCASTAYFSGFDISSSGLFRVGQAMLVAGMITIDYKVALRPSLSQEERTITMSNLHRRSAQRLLKLCRRNGGVYIKVGQHIGALDYLLPAEYVNTMKVLHSNAPKAPLSEIYSVIESDLKRKVEELFNDFEDEPIGSASLAQVHRAQLKDGTWVAVKVQHKNVKTHASIDIASMELLVKCVAYLFPDFRFLWLVEETKKNIPLELDFLNEGKNCEKCGKILSRYRFLKVPKVYWDFSSNRVLTMGYCPGGQVDDLQYMEEHQIDVNQVSMQLGKIYSEMIFVHGIVHCDPHPGNILVCRGVRGNVEVTLLDHGLYQTLTEEFRLNYCRLWQALIAVDLENIKKYAQALGAGDMHGLLACMVTARSWDAISRGVDRVQHSSAEDEEIQKNAALYLRSISNILNSIPRQMLLIMKTNDLLRGIEHRLGTRRHATSFLSMSVNCARAVAEHERKSCTSFLGRLAVTLRESLLVAKVISYGYYLRLISLVSTFAFS